MCVHVRLWVRFFFAKINEIKPKKISLKIGGANPLGNFLTGTITKVGVYTSYCFYRPSYHTNTVQPHDSTIFSDSCMNIKSISPNTYVKRNRLLLSTIFILFPFKSNFPFEWKNILFCLLLNVENIDKSVPHECYSIKPIRKWREKIQRKEIESPLSHDCEM